MAESEVHRAMKSTVRLELERDGYAVVEEPALPPDEKVHWTSYRPDLLGYRTNGEEEELVLVECETRPNIRRLGAKNFSSVWFQAHLYGQGTLRKILAVPQGRLRAVDISVGGGWEVWVLGTRTVMARFPKPDRAPAADVSRKR
ncbi:MAG: hypothetical protein JRN33_01860 [Nitrososphaerota archaeon]|nr:hypothetical protein [Nitrososphaerota archaeon]MDG6964292.1 hypothetical protein [Nitrososphaerota archaeon]